jgi:hypothetical protein
MGLPPLFRERAADMIAARAMREQAVEALRLVYVAQRREARRGALRGSVHRRGQLQQASGQVVITQGSV